MRHYAPNARVIPLEMSEHTGNEHQQRWLDAVQEQSNVAQKAWRSAARSMAACRRNFSGIHFAWGSWEDDQELAHRLFAGLRTLDAMGADVILCPLPPDSGLGAAIRDRLLKAARAR